MTVPRPLLAACLMGAGAGLIWWIALLFGVPGGTFWLLVAADVLLSLAAAFVAGGLAQDVGALGAGVIFPTLAFTALRFREPGGKPSYFSAIKLFLGVSAVSLIGGLLIAGCLSDLPHMMQMETFRGVKLAQVLPLLAVLMIWAGRCTKSYEDIRTETGDQSPDWPALRPGIVEATSSFVRYWHAVLILVGLAMLAIMVARSGNTTPVPPSDMELKVRSLLDQALIIRPRTKEIMLGHPVLLLGLAFLAAGRRRGVWVALLVGCIGQVSLVNTFGHIHTPLWISLVRVANGIWLGALVAGIVWLLLSRRIAPR